MKLTIRDDFQSWSKEKVSGFRKAMLRATLYLEGKVVEKAPVVTSTLRNSISTNLEGIGAALRGIVDITAKYAQYVIEGTGVYGPTGQPIKPKSKKALAFIYKGQPVVVRSVRGSKPNPFQEEALKEGESKIMELLEGFVK